MGSLLLISFGVAALMPATVGRLGVRAFLLGAAPSAATLAWALWHAETVAGGQPLTQRLPWASPLGLEIAFRLDALGVAMLVLVGGVGAVILGYSAWYFRSGERSLPMTAATLVAFSAAMTGLVIADNVFVLYVFWELTTVCSFLLIGHDDRTAANRRAAVQALLVTAGFGLVMLLGLVILAQAADSFRISAILADPPTGGAATTAVVLVLLGAFAKSAQVPLHPWLPAAMVAPTPVSAYLHAAAMVKAGVYLVARFAPAFSDLTVWRPLVLSVGLASLLVGGWRALFQDDLKRLLAFGTISQLGLLMVLFGAGTRMAALAGVALLLAHGFFKAALFLVVGARDHQQPPVRQGRPRITFWLRFGGAATLATASMIGIPPLLGYVAKEASLEAFLHGGVADSTALGVIVAGSVLTVAYGLRFLRDAFSWPEEGSGYAPAVTPYGLAFPVWILAIAGLGGGLAIGLVAVVAEAYASPFPARVTSPELTLWAGFSEPLALTVLILAAGFALYAALPAVRRVKARFPELPPADAGFRFLARATPAAALAVTRTLQVGSLPTYLVIILSTLLAVPGGGLVFAISTGTALDGASRPLGLWDHPVQVVLGVIVLASALGATAAQRRFPAVLLLTAAGYGVAGLFAAHGAPDLALTLVVVETLSMIMLVFVLRRLPERFPPRQRRSAAARGGAAALSGLVGVFVSVFLLIAGVSREAPSVGFGYVERAEQAGATNVVNAILVDFRALDTLGEIAVLLVASAGVASLVLLGPRVEKEERPQPAAPEEAREEAHEEREKSVGPVSQATDAAPPPAWEGRPRSPWLADPGVPPLGGRSVVLEVTTRLLFPTVLVFSLFLLFAGHSKPGGGFVGGLVAGMAYLLRYLTGGQRELAAAIPLRPAVFLSAGLLLAAGYGAAAWAVGAEVLQSAVLSASLPLLGHIEAATSLVFEVGVYLLVLGLVLSVVVTLGARVEEEEREGTGAGEQAQANAAKEEERA